jgi:DNA-binding MarR family transcriptional regulator
MPKQPFDLENFLPYLLNQAAEATSQAFQAEYRRDFDLSRTQWRVMANLGKFGAMTATDICKISHIEKTKVSRAVAALEARGWLNRKASTEDRRAEILGLTETGQGVFTELGERALAYDADLRASLGGDLARSLDGTLRQLMARLPGSGGSDD